MVYQGTFIKGVVVLDDAAGLRDGTRVNIQPVAASADASTEKFHPVGNWEGPPGELERLLQDVQQLRDNDLRLENERPDGSLSS